MHDYIYHIIGTMIAIMVFVILIGTQHAAQEASVDAAQYYMSKTRMLALVDLIERDFTNIGSGMQNVQDAIATLDTTSATRQFTFWARTDPASTDAQQISYQWTLTGTQEDDPHYEITRLVDGNPSMSLNSMTEVVVRLFDENLNPVVGNYPDTRRIYVGVRAAISDDGSGSIEQTQWSSMFRPVNLTR